MISCNRIRIAREVAALPLSMIEHHDMQVCMEQSEELWAGHIDGALACVWGIIPPTLMSSRAYLWLFVTPDMKGHEFLLVRHSQRQIERLLEEYSMLEGLTDKSADKSIRWLEWLGAEFYPHNDKFLRFEIRKR